MDERDTKFDQVLRIIEHPEDYSAEELKTLLTDPEINDLYNLLCKTESAKETCLAVDVEAEWDNFSQQHQINTPRRRFGLSNRAASIIIFIGTSLVAVAIGVAVITNTSKDNKDSKHADINVNEFNASEEMSSSQSEESSDTISAIPAEPILFEDASLAEIMETISRRYDVKVKFSNKDSEQLRLYYKFDPALTLDEIISQLNNFEQIHIIRNNNILKID